ncbi:hypothetical protein ACT4R0_09780 [Ornithobacterium rhinotracheale]|uniref:hypothetical protein n=1 Tax=Ornithobacterium rhinotracheale TaxID=28251 RepID=UPI004036B081
MKNLLILKLMIFSILSILLVNCIEKTDDTNSPSTIDICYFKDGKEIYGQKTDSIKKNITGYVFPEKGSNFTFSQEKNITSGGGDCFLPLYLNDKYKCTEADCKTKENFLEEIFTLKINYLQQEVFNKKLKFKYRKYRNNYFEVIEEVKYLDDSIWKPYKPEKISLLNEKGEPTNYEIEVKFVP